MLTWTSVLQARSGSLQRRWRVQRQPPGISSRWQVTPRQQKLIWCDIRTQTSHQARPRRRNVLWNLEHPATRMIQVTDHKYLHTKTIITTRALMPIIFTRTRTDARNREILYILMVSSVRHRNINASLATNMDTLQAYVIKRNKYFSSIGNQRLICYKWKQNMLVTSPYAATQKIVHPALSHSLCKWRYSDHELNVRSSHTL